MFKRIMSGFLTAAMLLTSIPVTAFAEVADEAIVEEIVQEEDQEAAQEEIQELEEFIEEIDVETEEVAQEVTQEPGTIYLAVSDNEKMLIEPTEIAYTAEQTTIRQVLAECTEYNFEFSGDFIGAIEGVSAGYYAYIDEGSYHWNLAPSEIQVLGFTTSVLGDEDEEIEKNAKALSKLIISMAEYNEMTGNIKNYAPAKAAYADGLLALQNASYETAVTAQADLEKAIADYEALMNSDKLAVNVTVHAGTATVENPLMTFTDASGNVTESSEGTTIELIPGEYTYTITDGSYNSVKGTLTVDGMEELEVELPSGNWFKDIQVRNKDKVAYESVLDPEIHQAEFFIDDTVGPNDLYIFLEKGEVPEGEVPTVHTLYTGTDGADKSKRIISWNANNNTLPKLLNEGMEGREFVMQAEFEAGTYTQVQSYTLKFTRVPTLSVLSAKENNEAGTSVLFGFASDVTAYDVATVSDQLYLEAEAYGEEGYTITGLGDVTVSDGDTVTVTVSHTSGQSREYVLNVTKTEAVSVTMNIPDHTTIELTNGNGDVINPAEGNRYTLIPGTEYTYVATSNGYFHTKASFVAKEGMTVEVATPDTEDALTAFALYDDTGKTYRSEYDCDSAFTSNDHEYNYTATDENSSAAVQATVINGYKAYALYTSQHITEAKHGIATEKAITYEYGADLSATFLTNALAACGYAQELTIRLTKTVDDVEFYQDYDLHIARNLHLSSVEVYKGLEELLLLNEDGVAVNFVEDVYDYYVSVTSGTESLKINGAFINERTTSAACGGYKLQVRGHIYDAMQDIEVALGDAKEQTIVMTVRHEDTKSVPQEYKIHVLVQDPVKVDFQTTPEDAIMFVLHQNTGTIVYASEDGTYELLPGHQYTYTVTCTGYVAQKVTDYIAPDKDSVVEIQMTAAEKNTAIDETMEAQWNSFRNTEDNNGVVDVMTPTTSDNTALYWATKVGAGYGSKATGCPIIVDGYIYTYAGEKIYKIDTINGEILAEADMVGASSYAINPPTYADGMIFVGLSNGRVQAFNAKTLESLWIFQDEIGGQPNCTLSYHDGYLYTGFWKGETQDGNFVCISVTDEDPSNPTEKKEASWSYTSAGGFYWVGAYECKDYMLIGTDDGESGYTKGYAHILSMDPKSGKILADLKLPFTGDVRSSITKYNGKYYFTSKGGYFYELTVNADGTFPENALRYIKLSNGANDETNPPMSTSSPTIHNGRAYVGVSGISQFGAYSGHNISVLDLNNWKVAYKVPTQGYPQTSGLLTTAYENGSEIAYVYFFDNYTPGKLRVICDKPGQVKPVELVEETYVSNGVENTLATAAPIFTPNGEHAQYALCSPIVDEYGTFYFKNDSACMMAVGNMIESIEVTKLPDKTEYVVGEIFDPTGIEVIATYSNGKTRDVSNYISYSKEPLTLDDTDFQIRFESLLYQNKDGESGVACNQPFDGITISIREYSEKELFESGSVNLTAASPAYNKVELSWDAYEYAVSYHLYRKDGSGAYKKIAWVKSGTTYTDTTVVPGTTYTYKIKAASDKWGKAVYSTDAETSIKPIMAKTSLTKVQTWGYSKLKLTWGKVAGASGYRIYYRTSTTGTWKYITQIAKGTTVSYIHTGRTAGQTYYYRVRAYRTVNGTKVYGAYSDIVSGKSVPSQVKWSSAAAGSKSATLKWNKVSGATGYRVYYKTANGSWTYLKETPNLSYKHTKLTSKTTYQYRVRAFRKVNGVRVFGAYSEVKSVKVK